MIAAIPGEYGTEYGGAKTFLPLSHTRPPNGSSGGGIYSGEGPYATEYGPGTNLPAVGRNGSYSLTRPIYPEYWPTPPPDSPYNQYLPEGR
jgi:hypothetical protein